MPRLLALNLLLNEIAGVSSLTHPANAKRQNRFWIPLVRSFSQLVRETVQHPVWLLYNIRICAYIVLRYTLVLQGTLGSPISGV